MSASVQRRCVFLPNRVCNVEADEIPLEVCRLCLDAWNAESKNIRVKRFVGEVEIPEAARIPQKPIVQTQPPEKEEEAPVKIEPREMSTSLAELDRLLSEGKIGLVEYLKRRKGIVESVRSEDSSLPRVGEQSNTGRWEARVLLVDRGIPKATYPEGWDPPRGFDARLLKAVYELCEVSGEKRLDMRLEIRGMRLINLGCKDRKLALLFLDSSTEYKDFEESIHEVRSELEMNGNWEAALPALYRKHFHARPPSFSYTNR